MLEKEGFLEYMAKLILNMASRSLDDLRSNTMLVAHCLGAMKTVAGLILSDIAPERYSCSLLQHVNVNGIVMHQYGISPIFR